MVNAKIDNRPICVEEGTTILKAASMLGIEIPRLCYLEGINEIGACRVCVVEVKGMEKLVASCNNYVQEGMEILTTSPRVRLARKKTVQLILSQHDCHCPTCVRCGTCSLQNLANKLNIIDMPYKHEFEAFNWDREFPLIRDARKCIKCMRCVQVCNKIQDLHIWDVVGTGSKTTIGVRGNIKIKEAHCSLCGQCITHCPVGALRERDDTEKLYSAIDDKDKIVVCQIAPAVRTSLGEMLSLPSITAKKIADALKKLGVDYVFDTSFSADLTIMEEANEFLMRYQNGELKDKPMFTSCCPGWLRFIKREYPHLIPQLSTAKSPQQMFGSIIKSYFASKLNVSPERICSVSIMPCVAKKSEARMNFSDGDYYGHETDIVLTTRELARMIKASHIDPQGLNDIEFDSLMQAGSTAGVIFGATGGVMEAALRTAYFKLTGVNPQPDAFKVVRANSFQDGIREQELNVNGIVIHTCEVSGLGNTRRVLESIESGEKKYDFVEVMACPGGCVGGGGQPIHEAKELAYERGKTLYDLDSEGQVRYSHENPDIIKLYEEYLGEPNSPKAHHLLHTDHREFDCK